MANINTKQLYAALMRPITLGYWKAHHTFPIKDPELVDWPSFGKALHRLPTGLQRFITKFNSGHIGNNHMLHHQNLFLCLFVKTVFQIWLKSHHMCYDADALQQKCHSSRTSTSWFGQRSLNTGRPLYYRKLLYLLFSSDTIAKRYDLVIIWATKAFKLPSKNNQ